MLFDRSIFSPDKELKFAPIKSDLWTPSKSVAPFDQTYGPLTAVPGSTIYHARKAAGVPAFTAFRGLPISRIPRGGKKIGEFCHGLGKTFRLRPYRLIAVLIRSNVTPRS